MFGFFPASGPAAGAASGTAARMPRAKRRRVMGTSGPASAGTGLTRNSGGRLPELRLVAGGEFRVDFGEPGHCSFQVPLSVVGDAPEAVRLTVNVFRRCQTLRGSV